MNLTFANKNPFSTFDFLGYFFPGALCLSLFYILTNGIVLNEEMPKIMPPAITFLKSFVCKHYGLGIFLLILFSYIAGHLLSYVSSITVELFYTWYYGYPTKYLLRKKNDKQESQYLLNSNLGIWGIIGHLVVCLLLFPILVGHFVFERFLHMKLFICRNLDDKLIDSISEKVKHVCNTIGYSNAESNDADVHRVVMHYVYEHCRMHQVKFDNYVALYGLLRSSALVFNLSFIIQFWLLFSTTPVSVDENVYGRMNICAVLLIIFIIFCSFITNVKKSKENKKKFLRLWAKDILLIAFVIVLIALIPIYILVTSLYENKSGEVIQLCGLFFATYLSYLGFAKFYRRFTLENFMALLICEQPKEVDNTINLKTEDSLNIKIDHPTNLTSEIFRFLSEKSKERK